MILKHLVVGPLEVNCYIVWDEKTNEATCIDPGGNVDEIIAVLNSDRLVLKYIINTHGHFDHIGGNSLLKKNTGAKLAIHREDAALLQNAASESAAFGMDAVSSVPPDIFLNDRDKIKIGNLTLEVTHTPGHTRGGICLLITDCKVLFTGDTIFAGGVGRTDLPGGSYKELLSSIKNKILPLGDNIRLFPGHGPDTTVAREKEFNPFLTELG